MKDTSHPPRGEWIEISLKTRSTTLLWSHPPRGEWIEISFLRCGRYAMRVSPPAG